MLKKTILLLLGASFIFLVGCSSQTEFDDDSLGKDFDDITSSAYDEKMLYEEIISVQLSFDMEVEAIHSVEFVTLTQDEASDYFDPERIYETFGVDLDVNELLTKYAIGTGVVLTLVVIDVFTSGGTNTFACFISGASQGAINAAAIGTIFGGAIGAITNYIQSDGDWKDTGSGAIEGLVDGYMWGAIFGAVQGGLSANYCFEEGTLIDTPEGKIPIEDIKKGQIVYSYNETTKLIEEQIVTNKFINYVDEILEVSIGGEIFKATLNHPFLTESGWIDAQDLIPGSKILSKSGEYISVDEITYSKLESRMPVYNFEVKENHNYIIGDNELIVHNKCIINQRYAGQSMYFDEGTELALKYPNGVKYDLNGFPDFSEYAIKTIKFDYPSVDNMQMGKSLTGNYNQDFILSNKAAGYGNFASSTPRGYTWHHHQDMMTMQLVPQDVHWAAKHTGGVSFIKQLLAGLS